MADLRKGKIISLVFILLFYSENRKVYANIRNVPRLYQENIDKYKETTWLEIGSDNGKYRDQGLT